eukprot:Selendium_serpulae@DN4228_c0_g1_i1.p1
MDAAELAETILCDRFPIRGAEQDRILSAGRVGRHDARRRGERSKGGGFDVMRFARNRAAKDLDRIATIKRPVCQIAFDGAGIEGRLAALESSSSPVDFFCSVVCGKTSMADRGCLTVLSAESVIFHDKRVSESLQLLTYLEFLEFALGFRSEDRPICLLLASRGNRLFPPAAFVTAWQTLRKVCKWLSTIVVVDLLTSPLVTSRVGTYELHREETDGAAGLPWENNGTFDNWPSADGGVRVFDVRRE